MERKIIVQALKRSFSTQSARCLSSIYLRRCGICRGEDFSYFRKLCLIYLVPS